LFVFVNLNGVPVPVTCIPWEEANSELQKMGGGNVETEFANVSNSR
jgi:hypothetical protein